MDNENQQKIYDEIIALKDLFVRRLVDDKIKNASIMQLKAEHETLKNLLDEKCTMGIIYELILICDRIDMKNTDDGFVISIKDEILEVLARRGIHVLNAQSVFDPRVHNAVGTVEANEEYPDQSIVNVIRKGFVSKDKTIRPADVIVAIKKK